MKDTRRTQVTPNIVIRPSFWTLNTCDRWMWKLLISDLFMVSVNVKLHSCFFVNSMVLCNCLYFSSRFLCLHALQFPVLFLLLFFCLPYPGLRNCESVFLILKIWQYCGSRQWVQHFQGISVRFDIRIEISIFIRPMITKIGKQIHVHD